MSHPVALITGGGSGIGLAIAEHLIRSHGYRVAIADIVLERVQEQALRLGKDNCLGLHLDVTDYKAQCRAFTEAFHWGGKRLDLFFGNAGIGDTDSLYKDTEMDESTGLPKPLNLRTIDVNLNSIIQGTHLARHFFTEKNSTPGGRIVVTSSVVGLYAHYCLPLYAASKHGLVGLIRSLAPVYAKDNITINSLHPTLIATGLMPPDVLAMWPREILTPMSTACKAFDAVLEDEEMTGQTIELALDDIVFKQQPEFSTQNTRDMFSNMTLWEMVSEPIMPRQTGENATFEYGPSTESP